MAFVTLTKEDNARGLSLAEEAYVLAKKDIEKVIAKKTLFTA